MNDDKPTVPQDSTLLDWLGANTSRRLFFDRSDRREPGCWVVEAPTGTLQAPARSFIGFGATPRDAIRSAIEAEKLAQISSNGGLEAR